MTEKAKWTKHDGGFWEWQKQKSSILCRCGCGEFITNRAAKNVEKGKPNAGYCYGHIWKGRSLPESAKQKMRENHADFSGEKNPNYGGGLPGELNPNWQGGRKQRYIKNNPPHRGNSKDKKFIRSVKERDGMCVLCGKISRLEAHHIEPYMESEELRYEIKNGVTLCKSCHLRADNKHHKDQTKPMLLAYINSLEIL